MEFGLNWELLGNPMNWLIVLGMLAIGVMLIGMIAGPIKAVGYGPLGAVFG